MIKELMNYLGLAFPEGVYLGNAPENMKPPYLTVDEGGTDYEEAVSADASRTRTGSYTVSVYAEDYASLTALLERLRLRVDRPGEVFELWGIHIGLMRIESEEQTQTYYLEDGETVVSQRDINVSIHYERI